jgi:hypothetical protein
MEITPMHHVSDIIGLWSNVFHMIPQLIFNKYLHFVITMHNVTTCPSTRYVVTLHGINCYITVLQQCKFTLKFHYIYLISTDMCNAITFIIFELIIYSAFNMSWIKNKNTDFGFMITYYPKWSQLTHRISLKKWNRQYRHQIFSCYKHRSR